ncbi:MAG: arginine--tRNA ligase [Selenomonadaceae bacterium]|nr:arginine--tRNA ligase [Selenomonadaceae bacterium]
MQIKNLIAQSITAAVERAVADNLLKPVDAQPLPTVELEVPPKKEFGDFATNFAMKSAKIFRTSPRKIADAILERIDRKLFDRIEIAGAGFMNFYLKPTVIYDQFRSIFDAGDQYGQLPDKGNRPIQIEYVSANPTGELHVGHGRGAASGSAIINIMRAAGYNVEAEYYINDFGNQMNNLARSVNARYLELLGQTVEFPADGYHGADIIDTARRIIDRDGDKYLALDETERLKIFQDLAYVEKLAGLREDLAAFRVEFDTWFSERTLHPDAINAAVDELRAKGAIYEKDGALWLRSTDYGDDKDRVVIRENGQPTYLAADIAYHKNKFERGFGTLINIWGADHHGYIARVKAAMAAFGFNPDDLKILLLQMVSLYRGGELVKMSKRTGKSITLHELIDEVGTDAARFIFLTRSMDSQLDFDLDLAVKKSSDNPVYYVQYAHARISSIFRQADEVGLKLGAAPKLELLTHSTEIDLINKIAEYEEEIDRAAEEYAPQRIVRYTHDIAALFHSFYRECRIIGVEQSLAEARLALIKVTAHVIRHALGLLGVSAPTSM